MKIVANNPLDAAREIHDLIGWTQPSDFTLEEIALNFGVKIKEIPIVGSEGWISMHGDSGIISLNSGITHQGKRHWVIAHELGHFALHKNIRPIFTDTIQTLSDWYKNGPQEQEANFFASELLMPGALYKKKVKGKKLNIGLVEEVADYFQVSLTATFLKYLSLGDFPLMVVYIESGIIKWKRHSDDFPFKFLALNSTVPAYTVAGDYFQGRGFENRPEKVDAIEWFPEDYQLKYNTDWKLWEQCFPVSENGLISCLWSL